MNGSGSNSGLTYKFFEGTSTRGIGITGSNRIKLDNVSIDGVYSDNGLAFGIDLINSCSDVSINNCSVCDMRGSNAYNAPLSDRIFQTGFSVTGVTKIEDFENYGVNNDMVIISASATGYNNFGNGCKINASATLFDAGVDDIQVQVDNGGYGYTFPPTISFKGFSAGNASSTVANGQVTDITPSDLGMNYASAPEVIISGGGKFASGATATVTIDGGLLETITITNRGTNYTENPTISFRGGGYSTYTAQMTNATATGVVPGTELPVYDNSEWLSYGYSGATIAPNCRPNSKTIHIDRNTTHTDIKFDTTENATGSSHSIPNNIIVTTNYP